MTSNSLKLNSDKTQFIWLGTRQQLAKVQHQTITSGTSTIPISAEVTCLGVALDSEIVGRCFYHLRLLRTTRCTITVDAAKTLINTFVTSRIDYCNAIFFHAAAVQLHPLQSVLNAAAKLIIQKRKYDHIMPVMQNELHWLLVPQHRIQGMSVRLQVPTSKCKIVS